MTAVVSSGFSDWDERAGSEGCPLVEGPASGFEIALDRAKIKLQIVCRLFISVHSFSCMGLITPCKVPGENTLPGNVGKVATQLRGTIGTSHSSPKEELIGQRYCDDDTMSCNGE